MIRSLVATILLVIAPLGPLRHPSPRFDRVLLLDTFADTSANASIADLNGDGNLDILLVKGRHWPKNSRVLLGDGRGHINSAHDLSDTPYRSYSGKLVDLDGDGHLDVVLSNDAPDPKTTFINDGTGHFRPGGTFGRPEWETRNAGLADLNGDGLPDIIVANRADSAIAYVCLNRGKGRFDDKCDPLAPASTTTITPADFNHDGLPDLAVPHRDGGQSYVYLNGGNARFANERRVPFGPPDARIRVAEAADLDGDGFLDIVVIDEARGVAIYHGRKDGSFANALPLDNGKVTPYALTVADLNRDGTIDIVVGNVEAPSVVYFNDGASFNPVTFGDNKGTVYGFAIADLDRDGFLDIAVAKSDAPSVVHFGDPPQDRK
jgi:hypothetical protein